MLDVQIKADLAKKHGLHETDTGSPEVQIALATSRIAQLQAHLNYHKGDESTRRGLLRLVGKRRRLLAYLRENHIERYQAIIAALGLRR